MLPFLVYSAVALVSYYKLPQGGAEKRRRGVAEEKTRASLFGFSGYGDSNFSD